MSFVKKASLIIYRFREQGLEIFLLDKENQQQLQLPENEVFTPEDDRFIELDSVADDSNTPQDAVAVEGDWHEIPSLKALLVQDAKDLKDKLREMERGTFVNLKEALKQVMPHQYAFLKELKDILRDRNSLRDL